MARKNKNKKNKNKKSAKEKFHEQISSSFENSQEVLAESVIESKPEDKTVETNIDKTKDTTAEVATKNTTDSNAKEVVKTTPDKTTQVKNQQQENSNKGQPSKKDKQSKNKKESLPVTEKQKINPLPNNSIGRKQTLVKSSDLPSKPKIRPLPSNSVGRKQDLSKSSNKSSWQEYSGWQRPSVDDYQYNVGENGLEYTRGKPVGIDDPIEEIDIDPKKEAVKQAKKKVGKVVDTAKEKIAPAVSAAKETGKKAVNATDKFLSKSPDLVKINKSSPDIFGGKFRLTKAGALGAVIAGSLFAVKDFGESYYREPASAGSATPLISSPVINAVQSSSSGLTPKNAMDNMGASGDLNFALRERNRLAPGQL